VSPRAFLLMLVCAYEAVALATRFVPTITDITHWLRDRYPVPIWMIAIGLLLYLGWHLLIEKANL